MNSHRCFLKNFQMSRDADFTGVMKLKNVLHGVHGVCLHVRA